MVEFAGYEMPLYYTSIKEEHMAVRQKCGIFDVSHMGRILVEGPDAPYMLDFLLPGNIMGMDKDRALYSFFLNEKGGFIDDLIVYRIAPERFLLVVNASRHDTDMRWLQTHAKGKKVSITDITSSTGMIAIQGPLSPQVMNQIFGPIIDHLKYYRFNAFKLIDASKLTFHLSEVPPVLEELDRTLIVARTGYTGEKGYEVIAPPDVIRTIWQNLTGSGITPAGLGARDSLRLEAGFPLYGNELTEDVTPLHTGMEKFIVWNKNFKGKEELQKIKEKGPEFFLGGIVCDVSGRLPRHGMTLLSADGKKAGKVTSGGYSPVLGKGIGLAFLNRYFQASECFLEWRKEKVPVRVVSPPFIEIRR